MNNYDTCPHCRKRLELPSNSIRNVMAFEKGVVLSKTECCGKGVILQPIRSYDVFPYYGVKTKDDWDREFSDGKTTILDTK